MDLVVCPAQHTRTQASPVSSMFSTVLQEPTGTIPPLQPQRFPATSAAGLTQTVPPTFMLPVTSAAGLTQTLPPTSMLPALTLPPPPASVPITPAVQLTQQSQAVQHQNRQYRCPSQTQLPLQWTYLFLTWELLFRALCSLPHRTLSWPSPLPHHLWLQPLHRQPPPVILHMLQ